MSGYVRYGAALVLSCGIALLAGCGSKPLSQPPVEDRGSTNTKPALIPDSRANATAVAPAKPVQPSDNAGKPGYYTVKPGDMLIRIGLDTGQSHKDIARWNNIENPNRIEVGQVIRIIPPLAGEVVSKPVTNNAVTATPIAPSNVQGTAVAPAKANAPAVASSAPVAAVVAAPASEDDMGWIWPGSGAILAGFDESKNKGVDIAGSAGDAVLAAADGRVVYAGAGLRGYGNLVILKHNNTYLTAYAHNQTLLVKEDQAIKKGQKIAEMGSTDADRVKLHFEVRRQGKPVDPLKYLPAK